MASKKSNEKTTEVGASVQEASAPLEEERGEGKDPTLFLIIWLGLPLLLMILYAALTPS